MNLNWTLLGSPRLRGMRIIGYMTSLVLATTSISACVPHAESTSASMEPGRASPARDAGAQNAAGTLRDAASDAASDACGGSCRAPTSICDASSKKCVQCLEQGDCKSPAASRCNIVTNACEACRANNVTDCDGIVVDGLPRNLCLSGTCLGCRTEQDCGAAASVCDNNLCVPCTTNAQCEHVADRPLCDTGVCASCAGTDDCGGVICDRLAGSCTVTAVGSAAQCDACVATAQCAIGVCAPEQAVDGAQYRCLPVPAADGACPAGGPRQYNKRVKRVTAERTAAEVCIPGILSCTELSLQGAECGSDAECGGVGRCLEGLCALRCDVDTDCPEDRFCRTHDEIEICTR